MVADALAGGPHDRHDDAPAGSDASVAAAPTSTPSGTAGEIVENEELPDGRFNILLEARFRFRVLDEDPPAPYRVARVEEMPTASFREPDDEERSVASAVDLFGDVAARARAAAAAPRDAHRPSGSPPRSRSGCATRRPSSRPPRDRFAAVALRASAPADARVEEPAPVPRALPGQGPRPAEELTGGAKRRAGHPEGQPEGSRPRGASIDEVRDPSPRETGGRPATGRRAASAHRGTPASTTQRASPSGVFRRRATWRTIATPAPPTPLVDPRRIVEDELLDRHDDGAVGAPARGTRPPGASPGAPPSARAPRRAGSATRRPPAPRRRSSARRRPACPRAPRRGRTRGTRAPEPRRRRSDTATKAAPARRRPRRSFFTA